MLGYLTPELVKGRGGRVHYREYWSPSDFQWLMEDLQEHLEDMEEANPDYAPLMQYYDWARDLLEEYAHLGDGRPLDPGPF